MSGQLPRWMLLLHTASLLVGFVIFLRGFLVLKTPIDGHATWEGVTLEPGLEEGDQHDPGAALPAQFDRLVVVLVDALRADFVLPGSSSRLPQMEFVKELITENKTLSFLAKAHPPTVTLPRIKALTTGSVPGFVDVVLNFDSAALQEDNLMSQMYRHNKTMVFYGDDTWMKLFPDHFLRQDGTTSFFVTDYTEVDNNVTRHLDSELEASDWEVLVLHYLGLDHIGHLAGPYSPLVRPKLQEMDAIVERIYQTLLEQDAASGGCSLLLLCGDHGMSDHGSHGGSSAHEVNTPFVMMSSRWAQATGAPFTDQVVNQVDVVPTLALLFGLPIPQNSLGSAILPALHTFSAQHQLAALHINTQQLLKVFKLNIADFEKEPSYQAAQRAVAAHASWVSGGRVEARVGPVGVKYTEALAAMRGRLTESLTTYDLHAMGVGILLLWVVSLSVLLTTLSAAPYIVMRTWSVPLAVLLCAGCVSGHVVLCTGPQPSPLLCDAGPVPALLTACGTLLLCCCLLHICSVLPTLQINKLKGVWQGCGLCGFLLLGTGGHSLSLAASSLVEEEHQTWYLLTTTAELLLLLHLTKQSVTPKPQQPPQQYTQKRVEAVTSVSPLEEEYIQVQEIIALHAQCFDNTIQRGNAEQKDHKGDHKEDYKGDHKEDHKVDHKEEAVTGSQLRHQVAAVVMSLVAGRAARAWNRTGDKWAHLPDIGDWLVDGANKRELSSLVVAAMCAVSAVRWRRGVTSSMSNLLIGGFICVYCFRAANGALRLPLFYGKTADKGILEARAVYSILATMLVATALYYWRGINTGKQVTAPLRRQGQIQNDNKKPSVGSNRTMLLAHIQMMWTVVMVLLLRPHNIPLVFLITLMEVGLEWALRPADSLPTWAVTLLYLWMGQACFFYQGNSNSFSTVDVSAGYIGLKEFTPGVVSLLLGLATYAGPIFWTLSLLKLLSAKMELDASQKLKWRGVLGEVGVVLVGARVLPLAVYTCLTTVQRYHLFVWTVFSPKLLYEGMLTVVTAAAVLLLQLVYYV